MYVSECLESEGQVNLRRLSCTDCVGVRSEDVALINKINPVETPQHLSSCVMFASHLGGMWSWWLVAGSELLILVGCGGMKQS